MELLSELLNKYPKVNTTASIIGLIYLVGKLLKLIKIVYKHVIRRRIDFAKTYGAGSWALITGSSDGIGKAFAFSFARYGFNIILSARTESKLEKAKEELLAAHPDIQVRLLVVDYKKSADDGYLQEKLEELRDLDISILVNNVGVDVLNYYDKLSLEEITSLIKCNCFSVSVMNRLLIPVFLKRHSNKLMKSAIINVASIAGEIPMPLHNVYSASKAFIDILSRALSYQYSGKIDIISLSPSEVSTPMTCNKPTDLLTIMPKDCAEGLLNHLGHQKTSNGNWRHAFQSNLYANIPQSLFNFVWLNYLGPDFMNERLKAQKKA